MRKEENKVLIHKSVFCVWSVSQIFDFWCHTGSFEHFFKNFNYTMREVWKEKITRPFNGAVNNRHLKHDP